MEKENNQANWFARRPWFQGWERPRIEKPPFNESSNSQEEKEPESQKENPKSTEKENSDDTKNSSFNWWEKVKPRFENDKQPLPTNQNSSWKDTDSSWKRAEGSSVKMIKDAIVSKVEDTKTLVNKSNIDVESLIDKNIEALNSEKRLFEGAWKSEMVEVIAKKISTYEANKNLIQSWVVKQDDLNKLYAIFNRDNDNISQKISAENKEKNYNRFIDQLNTFHWKVDIKHKKTDLEVIYEQEVSDEKSINKAIKSIEKDLKSQSADLKKVAKELSLRGKDGDVEKMNRLLKHAEEYDKLISSLENWELDDSQKKWLILFAQSDEERHKYLTERLVTQNYNYDRVLSDSKKIIIGDINSIPEFYFKDSFGKMLDEEAIQLFEAFAKIRAKIPGLGDVLPTDDLETLGWSVLEYLTDEEVSYLDILKQTKSAIYEFNATKDETTAKYLNEVFNEREYSIDFQISDNDEFKNNELAKIDLLNLSDEEKKAQKDIILEWYAKIDTKLQLEKARLSKERVAVEEVSSKFDFNEELIKKHSSKMSIYSLTADKNKIGWALEALSYETLEWRWVWYDLGIDVKNIKDYSLVSRHRKQVWKTWSLSRDNIKNAWKMLASDTKRASELLMWKVGETKHEQAERYKKLDSLIAKKANGAFAWVSLMIFSWMEWLVNSMENSPKHIAATTKFIQKGKMWILTFAILLIAILVFNYDPTSTSALIELNSRMYSFANFTKDGNGVMSFESNWLFDYKAMFLKTSLLTFLTAIIVMYSVIIEIMSKYIEFLKNSDDKSNMEQIMTSLWKTVLFFLYFWLIFKLFI